LIIAGLAVFSCFTAAALAANLPPMDESAILAQAETLLGSSFGDAGLISESNPFPLGVKLTGPFVYLGSAENPSELFVPDISTYDYEPAGLPEGAALYVYDSADILDMYPNILSADADAPVVYVLLLSTGYYNKVLYEGDITIYDHKYAVLFVDYATWEIIAWSDVATWVSGPYYLAWAEYYTDRNGRKVFRRENATSLSEIWQEALLYATADDTGAVIRDGTLVTMNDRELTAYTVPDGVTTIGARAFTGCDRLESLVLPEGVETVEDGAFAGCTALTDISFPSTLKSVGAAAFADTPWLTMQAEEPFVIAGDGVLIAVHAEAAGVFETNDAYWEIVEAYGYPSEWDETMRQEYENAFGSLFTAGELMIPEGVRYLAAESISNVSVDRLVLPGTLEEDWAAETSLWNVTAREIYLSDGITELPFGVFAYCSGVERIRLPESLTALNAIDVSMDSSSFVIVCPSDSWVYGAAEALGYTVVAEE